MPLAVYGDKGESASHAKDQTLKDELDKAWQDYRDGRAISHEALVYKYAL